MGTSLRGRMYGQLLLVMLAACSNGSGSLEDQPPPPSQGAQSGLTIGGSVSGLSGGSFVLQNNGAGDLTVAGDGSFTFPTTVSSGAAYNVTVLTQPSAPPQTCTVASGAGSVTNSNVTNIVVTCTTAPRYRISVVVSGLSGSGLVLQNNAGDNLSVSSNGNFDFATPLSSGSAYSITVGTHPNGQNCIVRNATGTIAAANVSNVQVDCVANQFTVEGQVSGLVGTGLVLQLNGGNDLSILSNGKFSFPVTLSPNTGYAVTVKEGAQPTTPWQKCDLTNPAGTITNANVANVAVTCVTSNFAIGGDLSGLAGAQVVLRLNGANDLAVKTNGKFTFPGKIPSGSSYVVTVQTQPSGPAQICTPAHAGGTVGGADVVTVAITCATQTFSVGGTVIGLIGSPLVLQNNLANDLPIAANGPFVFSAKIANGGRYAVTVRDGSSPVNPTQACSIANDSGTIGLENVNNVVVSCSTSNFYVSGTVNNLLGTGLQLINNDTETLTVRSPTFRFRSALPSGSPYSVQVARQPTSPNQTCTVDPTTASGTIGSADAGITVNCVNDGFHVGGNVSGLRSAGLIVQINGVENVQVDVDGSFQFPTLLPSNTPYNVIIVGQPADPMNICYVTAESSVGIVGTADVTSVQVLCL